MAFNEDAKSILQNDSSKQFSLKDWLCQKNLRVLVLLAWAIIAIELLVFAWAIVGPGLVGPDDALRLVEVRNWLGGQGWFNLHFSRLYPPLGYDSQWSRLIDVGLGGLFLLFHVVLPTHVAELLMEQVWPLLWILPAITGVVAISYRLRGRDAALLTLLFLILSFPAMFQFGPGRIDHHNVQITLALLALAATIWSDRKRWTAWAAGFATGLGITIGIEAVPFHLLCGIIFAVRFVLDPQTATALRRYSIAIAVSTGAGFLISVSPSHWSNTLCDAIAINSAAPLVFAGVALAIVSSVFTNARTVVRIGLIASVGVTAAATFAFIEPRCLAGPFGMNSPAIRSLWAMHTIELQSVITLLRTSPLTALEYTAFPLIAVIAFVILISSGEARNDFAFWGVSAVVLLAIVAGLTATRFSFYADWFGIPIVATSGDYLLKEVRLKSPVSQVIAGLMLVFATPSGMLVLSDGIGRLAVIGSLHNIHNNSIHNNSRNSVARPCLTEKNYRSFAKLPAGLVLSEITYGPFVLAYTPHSVVAAPYDRLGNAIVLANEGLLSPSDKAHKIISRLHVNYVLICNLDVPRGLIDAKTSASLWYHLHMGQIPSWLQPINGTKAEALTIYRVKS